MKMDETNNENYILEYWLQGTNMPPRVAPKWSFGFQCLPQQRGRDHPRVMVAGSVEEPNDHHWPGSKMALFVMEKVYVRMFFLLKKSYIASHC